MFKIGDRVRTTKPPPYLYESDCLIGSTGTITKIDTFKEGDWIVKFDNGSSFFVLESGIELVKETSVNITITFTVSNDYNGYSSQKTITADNEHDAKLIATGIKAAGGYNICIIEGREIEFP